MSTITITIPIEDVPALEVILRRQAASDLSDLNEGRRSLAAYHDRDWAVSKAGELRLAEKRINVAKDTLMAIQIAVEAARF